METNSSAFVNWVELSSVIFKRKRWVKGGRLIFVEAEQRNELKNDNYVTFGNESIYIY